jgi:outer membrane lipoprotein SlyB
MNDHAAPSSKLPSSALPAGLEDDPNVKPVAGASAGLLAGAAIGAFAGPIGAIAGAVAGAVAGAAAGVALDTEAVIRGNAERQLDEDIGVTAGDIGVASPIPQAE